MGRPHRRLALLVLVAMAVLAAACVNQGIDAGGPTTIGGRAVGPVTPGPVGDGAGGAAVEAGGADDAGGDAEAPRSASGGLPDGAVADPGSLATVEEVPCSFDQPLRLPIPPICHDVTVPEDWSDPDLADPVVLHVAVFPGDGSHDGDPYIYFDGGPGGHTLDTLSFSYPVLIAPFLSGRDYIVFDQRGVGVAEPSLDCPELARVARDELLGILDRDAFPEASLVAQGRCRDRLLDAGVDLTAYNSVASANDVEAIRSLLGYDQLNVIGISYGTRLAQSYLRQYPDSVRTVVLDSIFPTGADLWSEFVPGARRAFERLFAGCLADSACASTHPDLQARFFALLDRLDAEPIEVTLTDRLTRESFPATLDGSSVMALVFSALYDQPRFSLVPAMVAELERGEVTTAAFLGSVVLTNQPFFSEGMYRSVECNEEIPFESEQVLEANRPTDPGWDRLARLDSGLTIFETCRAWPAGRAPEVEAETVFSDVPALLLGGDYDPITPPSGIDTVAAGLPNSYAYLLANEGHGITPTDCGVELIVAFVDDPATAPDDSCVAASPAPPFVPEAGPTDAIDLVAFETDGLLPVRGLRPAAWTDLGNGIFVRQRTALDETTLIIQPSGGVDPQFLVSALGAQAGIELAADGTRTVGGRELALYRTSEPSTLAARMLVSPGVDGVLVLLVTEADEIDDLDRLVLTPVAAAASAG